MKFEGVLVRPLADQGDRDDYKIDPAGVAFEDGPVPIWRNFNYDPTMDLLGEGTVFREGGALMVRGELNEQGAAFARGKAEMRGKLAIGVQTREGQAELHKGAGSVVHECDLMSVALTWEHQDPAQPAIRLLDDPQW
jgi:hypothetical protein